jgi:hypothetical protein
MRPSVPCHVPSTPLVVLLALCRWSPLPPCIARLSGWPICLIALLRSLCCRYGAAMAVGLACAGTGLREATALLEPMMTDPTDFVRQVCTVYVVV